MNWQDIVKPAGEGIKQAAKFFGGPLAGLIAEAGVDLIELGIDGATKKLTREEIIQQVDDRCVDLLRVLKTGGS